MDYEPELDLRAARAAYFQYNHFGDDGGYNAKWVIVTRVGPIPVGFPNSAARVEAVRFHDLHHLVTGYDTDLLGEAEIGAWEVASGCAGFLVAWGLNGLAMTYGMLLGPRRVFAAFVRGRHSRNFYKEPFNDQLLARRLGDAADDLGTTAAPPPATLKDRLLFAAWITGGWTLALGAGGTAIAAVWMLLS